MDKPVKYQGARKARNKDAELVFDSFGEPSDPAVLFIMGLGDQMITWHEDLCRMLAAKGFHVIRFDNRDIGLSTRFSEYGVPDVVSIVLKKMMGLRPKGPYSLSDMAGDAVAVLDAAGVERACLVGASMGGMIAQVAAIEHPERVGTLVSTISSGQLVPGPRMAFDFLAWNLKNLLAGPKRLPFSPSPGAFPYLFNDPPQDREGFSEYYARLESVLVGPGYEVDSDKTREFAKQLFDRGLSPDGTVRQFAGILSSPSRIADLKKLDLPTLVIHGDSDPLIPVWLGVQTADHIPGAELVVFPGLGHWLPPAMWPEFTALVAAFARR